MPRRDPATFSLPLPLPLPLPLTLTLPPPLPLTQLLPPHLVYPCTWYTPYQVPRLDPATFSLRVDGLGVTARDFSMKVG